MTASKLLSQSGWFDARGAFSVFVDRAVAAGHERALPRAPAAMGGAGVGAGAGSAGWWDSGGPSHPLNCLCPHHIGSIRKHGWHSGWLAPTLELMLEATRQ